MTAAEPVAAPDLALRGVRYAYPDGTPGLDGIYIGPSDLSIGLGHPPTLDPSAKEVLDAIDDVMIAAYKHNVCPGIHCSGGEGAKAWSEKGFRFCTLASDSRFLAAGAKVALAVARGK